MSGQLQITSVVIWKRIVSNIIDSVFFLLVVILIIGILFGGDRAYANLAGAATGVAIVFYYFGYLIFFGEYQKNTLLSEQNVYSYIFLLLFLLFMAFQQIIFGRTLGKAIMRLKVTDGAGQKPSAGLLLLRELLKLLPLIRVSLMSRNPPGAHNIITKLHIVEATPVINIMKVGFLTKRMSVRTLFRRKTSSADLKKLDQLYNLKAKGAISDDEYNNLKSEILESKYSKNMNSDGADIL